MSRPEKNRIRRNHNEQERENHFYFSFLHTVCGIESDAEINQIWIWNIHIYLCVCKTLIEQPVLRFIFCPFLFHFRANSLYPFVTLTNADLEWIYINFLHSTHTERKRERKKYTHSDDMEISDCATYGFDRLKIKLATQSLHTHTSEILIWFCQ